LRYWRSNPRGFRVPAQEAGHDDQARCDDHPDDHETHAPAVMEDQPSGGQRYDELAGAGAHLDDAGHKPPAMGEPAGDGGQGDDIDGTAPHAENDAVEQVEFPGGRQAGHKYAPQSHQQGRDDHDRARAEPVV
jgi:hypothetical protein